VPIAKKSRGSSRSRVGKVGVYLHHGSWWVRFREHGKLVRRRISAEREAALRVAAEINAQLACAAPTLLSFTPIFVAAFVAAFLRHHEEVLQSTTTTVARYQAALAHLVNFVDRLAKPPNAHQIRADEFAAYLRTIEVAPNGHAKARRRPLRDKGVRYILETARSLYSFARKRRHLPPYADNPFAELPLDRFRLEDSKPIVLFDEATEVAFFRAADVWEFAFHFFLAKTGLRLGEALHLLIENVNVERSIVSSKRRAA
jgi:integrase